MHSLSPLEAPLMRLSVASLRRVVKGDLTIVLMRYRNVLP